MCCQNTVHTPTRAQQFYLRTKWHPYLCIRLATIDMGQKLGVCYALSVSGSWVPIQSNTVSTGPRPTSVPNQVASSSIHLAKINMDRKVERCYSPIRGASWDNVALAEAYFRTEWYPDPSSSLATIHTCQKCRRLLSPFPCGRTAPKSNTVSPGTTPSSVRSVILIHQSVWPQQTWAEKRRAAVSLSVWGSCVPI